MRQSMVRLAVLGLTGSLSCLPLAAQQLISAKSGLIHYTEGDVKIGAQAASPNNGIFQSLAVGKELTTGEGRAEMLLGPGQFVRLNENTSVKMVSNKLDATRIDVLRGSVIVEIVDLAKSTSVIMGLGDNVIDIRKIGLYRVDATESRLRVYDGEAFIEGAGQTLTAKKGKEVTLGAVYAQNGFDMATGDEFSRWAQRRAGYVATANVSAARNAFSNGGNTSANNWAYNPWYGMYTYIPGRRPFMSPFGYYYFSPEFAYNDMFWNYLGGGYGFYGLGFGPGYGFGNGFGGYGYGYGFGSSGYGYGNPGGYGYTGGGGGSSKPGKVGPNYPTTARGTGFGPRGTTTSGGVNNSGNGMSRPVMTRGGGGFGNGGHAGSYGGGGGSHSVGGGGGFSNGSGGGHSSGGGGGFSGGGGRSVGSVSGGGGSSASASTGGAATSGGGSAGGRAK